MLRALITPAAFAGLLVGFLAAVVLSYLAQSVATRLLTRHWGFGARPADAVRPRRVLDPFGGVAAAIAGPGWGRSVPPSRTAPAYVAVVSLLAGPVVVAVGGLAVLALLPAVGLDPLMLAFVGPADLIGGVDLPFSQALVLCAGLEMLAVAVLALVPLPPLPMWKIVDRLVPNRSLGWQKTKFWLEERNIGVVILLVLLLLPLGGGVPLMSLLVDAGARALTGLLW